MRTVTNNEVIINNPKNRYWKKYDGKLCNPCGEDYLYFKLLNEVGYEDLKFLDYQNLNINHVMEDKIGSL